MRIEGGCRCNRRHPLSGNLAAKQNTEAGTDRVSQQIERFGAPPRAKPLNRFVQNPQEHGNSQHKEYPVSACRNPQKGADRCKKDEVHEFVDRRSNQIDRVGLLSVIEQVAEQQRQTEPRHEAHFEAWMAQIHKTNRSPIKKTLTSKRNAARLE